MILGGFDFCLVGPEVLIRFAGTLILGGFDFCLVEPVHHVKYSLSACVVTSRVMLFSGERLVCIVVEAFNGLHLFDVVLLWAYLACGPFYC